MLMIRQKDWKWKSIECTAAIKVILLEDFKTPNLLLNNLTCLFDGAG